MRQIIIGWVAAITLVAALFEWAWLPYTGLHERYSGQRQSAEDAYYWIEDAIARLKQSPGVEQTQVATLEVLEQSLARTGLREAVIRIEPQNSGVHVSIESARFSTVLRWLALLESQLGVSVVSMAVTSSTAGTVSGRVILAGLQF